MTSGLTRTSGRPSLPHSSDPSRASDRWSWKTPPREHHPTRRLLPSKRLRPLKHRLHLSHRVHPVPPHPLRRLYTKEKPRSWRTRRRTVLVTRMTQGKSRTPTASTTKDKQRPVRLARKAPPPPSASAAVVVSARMAHPAQQPTARPAQATSKHPVHTAARVVPRVQVVMPVRRRRSRMLPSLTALLVHRATNATRLP